MPRSESSGDDRSAGMKGIKDVNEVALKLQNCPYRGHSTWNIKTQENPEALGLLWE